MTIRNILALAAAGAAMLAAVPAAAKGADMPRRGLAGADCFNSRDWTNWSSPSPDVIYLKVRNRDVYRVDLLASGHRNLDAPGKYLLTTQRSGSGRVCSPLDLDLKLGDLSGFATPLFPQAITRLTRDEIAALPRKDRP